MTWTPRLRTVLLIVNVIILAMPLGAIAGLRIYDSELIRQTEAELIAQGAFVEAVYRSSLRETMERTGGKVTDHGHPATAEITTVDDKFLPVAPRLDANSDQIRPPAPDPTLQSPELGAAELEAGERLEPILQEAQRITFAGIRVVDARGQIVASTAGERGDSIATHEEISRALSGEFVSLLRERVSHSPRPPLESISRGTKVRVFVAMPVIVDDHVVGAVVLSRTPMGIMKALYQNRLVFIGMLLSLLIGVTLITLLTLVTIQRPIRALIEQTRRIARSPNQTHPIEQPGTLEFAELSTAFSTMAHALHVRDEYITTFARNVSHEFKTPLTSIRGSVELLQDHLDEMAPAERQSFLDVVAKDCERLDSLVGGLLELARADLFRPGAESTDVTAAAHALAAALQAPEFSITVEGPKGLNAAISPEALDAVLRNLLANARKHGGEHATVRIKPTERTAVLEVFDDGPGIDPEDVDKVFEAFFTTARGSGGTGLGLSIVRTLVQTHGGTIALTHAESARFEVTLPL